MSNEVYGNPWASALPLSPAQESFWVPGPSHFSENLRYLFGAEAFLISGENYEGFTRIWRDLLNSRQQLNEADVVNLLRSSRMTDEALGNAWHEASQAVLLETGPNQRSTVRMENSLEWRDFIILLDRCYRISGSDLTSFLGRFPLPARAAAVALETKNPFHANYFAESATQPTSHAVVSNVHSISSMGNYPQPGVSYYPASPPQSPQSHLNKALPPSPPSYRNEFEMDSTTTSTRPAKERTSYLEDMQDLHVNSQDKGAKNASTIHGSSTLSNQGTESIRSMSPFSSVRPSHGADVAPLLPHPIQKGGFDFSRTKSEPIVSPDHPFFGEHGEHSEAETQNTPLSPISPSITQKELPQSPKTSRRSSLFGRIRGGSASGPSTPVDQHNPSLPGITEVEAPQSDPEVRKTAHQRLVEIESREASTSPSISMKRRKSSQSSNPFSLATLAAGLEEAAGEGSLPIVEAILEFGADPNFRLKGAKSSYHRALDLAAISGHPHIIDYLVQRGADSTAINTALIHALLADKAQIATHLIVKQHADVNTGIFLTHANPGYGAYASSGHRANIEYLNVLSAASKITSKKERLQFIELLLSRDCNVNAYIWRVYKLKEATKPKGLTEIELETGSHYGTPKIIHDCFGYSPLGRFSPICAESVKVLIQAGAAAYTIPQKPPPEITVGFKTHGFPSKTHEIVQPISCITSEAWQLRPAECLATVKVLARHGANLSCNEPNGYEEKHAGRRAAWGAFEEKWSPPSKSLTPASRAMAGRCQDGAAYLVNLGGK